MSINILLCRLLFWRAKIFDFHIRHYGNMGYFESDLLCPFIIFVHFWFHGMIMFIQKHNNFILFSFIELDLVFFFLILSANIDGIL